MTKTKVDHKNYEYKNQNEKSNSNEQVNRCSTRKRVEGSGRKNEEHHYHYYPYKKLYRSTSNKWLGGVCGGIAEHYNKDPTLIRLLWIIGTIISFGVGVFAYIAFLLVVDKYPANYALPPKFYEQSYKEPNKQTNKQSARRSVHIHYY